jgi:alkylation response protein AidB-like acyl-CoA dehydrogenase
MSSTELFPLPESAQRLRRAVREWAVNEARPLAREADRTHAPPQGADAVLNACPLKVSPLALAAGAPDGGPPEVPENSTHLAALMLMEDVTYGDVWPMNLQRGAGLAHKLIPLLGTPEQVEHWVGGLEQGRFRSSAFALTEAHFGSDVSQVATTAVRDGEGWVLNGAKMFCSGGATADFLIVFASIDPSRGRAAIRAFIVERDTPGFQVVMPNERKLGLRSQDTATVAFDEVWIPSENLLGQDVEGAHHGLWGALETLTFSRPFMASAAVGIAQAAIDYAAAWVEERRAEFTFDRLRQIERDIETIDRRLHDARYLIHRVGWLRDRGKPAHTEGSMAKAYAPRIAEVACLRALQLLGPEGASEQHLLEKWYRDVKVFDIFEGSGQIQRVILARRLLAS